MGEANDVVINLLFALVQQQTALVMSLIDGHATKRASTDERTCVNRVGCVEIIFESNANDVRNLYL